MTTDETRMPDGRPLFAWRNEIEMQRAEYQRLKRDQEEVRAKMLLLNIVEIEQARESHSGDYLFRVRLGDLVSAYSPLDAIERAEISRVKK